MIGSNTDQQHTNPGTGEYAQEPTFALPGRRDSLLTSNNQQAQAQMHQVHSGHKDDEMKDDQGQQYGRNDSIYFPRLSFDTPAPMYATGGNPQQDGFYPPPPPPPSQGQPPPGDYRGYSFLFHPQHPPIPGQVVQDMNLGRRPSEQLEPFFPSNYPRSRQNSYFTRPRQGSILPSNSIPESQSDFDNFLKRDSFRNVFGESGDLLDNLPLDQQQAFSRQASYMQNMQPQPMPQQPPQQQQQLPPQQIMSQQQQQKHIPPVLPIPKIGAKDTINGNKRASGDGKSSAMSTLNDYVFPGKSTKKQNKREPVAKKLRKTKIQQQSVPQQQQQTTQPVQQTQQKGLVPAPEVLHGEDGRPLVGATKVDQLMLVIQARNKGVTKPISQAEDGTILEDTSSDRHILPAPTELVGGIDKPTTRRLKQHQCQYCSKKFGQATHLEVHIRSHIGLKPYECKHCHKRFTQGGNLRTHMRLHTGERPYKCEDCDRSFSRKGNLQAHQLTHKNVRPFLCKLDNCNKSFTQLGNLKSHQNRFHLETLNNLTAKLAHLNVMSESDLQTAFEHLPNDEKELLQYFSSLYKNLNRGIRGRGKRTESEEYKKEESVGFNGGWS